MFKKQDHSEAQQSYPSLPSYKAHTSDSKSDFYFQSSYAVVKGGKLIMT